MKQISLIFILTILFSSCQEKTKDTIQEDEVPIVPKSHPQSTEGSFTFQTIHEENVGWGYQILNHGKLYINQPHIPSIQGHQGFDTEAKAQKTVEFIIYKLNKNLFPPTVTPAELDSLEVL